MSVCMGKGQTLIMTSSLLRSLLCVCVCVVVVQSFSCLLLQQFCGIYLSVLWQSLCQGMPVLLQDKNNKYTFPSVERMTNTQLPSQEWIWNGPFTVRKQQVSLLLEHLSPPPPE